MILFVDLVPRKFTISRSAHTNNENEARTYDKCYIDRKCLLCELKRYQSICTKTHEDIKKLRTDTNEQTNVESFRESV